MSTQDTFYLLSTTIDISGVPSFGAMQRNGSLPSTTASYTFSGPDTSGGTSSAWMNWPSNNTNVWITNPPIYPQAGGVLSGTVKVINGSSSFTPSGLPYTIPNRTRVEFTSQLGTLYVVSSASNVLNEPYSGSSNAATTVNIHMGAVFYDSYGGYFDGDCFSSPTALTASYTSDTWIFSFVVKVSGSLESGQAQLACRLWAGTAQNGSNAVELTSSRLVTGNIQLNVTTPQTVQVAWAAPAVNLSSEYLFLQVACLNGPANATNIVVYQDPNSYILTNNSPSITCNGITKSPVLGSGVIVVDKEIFATGVTKTPQVGVAYTTVKSSSSGVTKSSVPGIGEGFCGCITEGTGEIALAITGVGHPVVQGVGQLVSPVLGTGQILHVLSGSTVHPVLGVQDNTIITQSSGVTKSTQGGVSSVQVKTQATGVDTHPVLGHAMLTVTGDVFGYTVNARPGTQDCKVVPTTHGVNVTLVRGIGIPLTGSVVFATGAIKTPRQGVGLAEIATQAAGQHSTTILGIARNHLTTYSFGFRNTPVLGIQDCQVATRAFGVASAPVDGTMAYSGFGAIVMPVDGIPKPPTSNGFGHVCVPQLAIADCLVSTVSNGHTITSNPGSPYCYLETFPAGVTEGAVDGAAELEIVSRTRVLDVTINLQ